MLAVEDGTVTRAYLREHIERRAAAFVFRRFSRRDERRDESVVKGQTRDMSAGVDTKTVHTHVDKRGVALYQVLIDGRILRIEVHAVAGDLEEPAVGLVPVAMREMMPVVMGVVVLFLPVLVLGILHLRQSRRILFAGLQLQVVIRQHTAVFLRIRHHTVERRLVG